MKSTLTILIATVLLSYPRLHAQGTERIRDVIYAKHDGVALTMDIFKNSARLLVRGKLVEHWLIGELAVKFEMGGEDWQARIAKSKFTSYPRYGLETKGRICFQDHGHTVAFRNVKILPL